MKMVQNDLDSHRLKSTEGVKWLRTNYSGSCWRLMVLRTRGDAYWRWRRRHVKTNICSYIQTESLYHWSHGWSPRLSLMLLSRVFFGSYATISCLLFIFSLAALLLSCCCFWAVNFMAVGQLFKCKPSADNSSSLGSKTSHAPTWFYLPRTIEEWTYLLTCLLTYLLTNTLDLFTGRHVPCCWYDVDHRCLLVKAWFWQIWEAFSFRLEKGLVSQRDYI